MKIEQHLASERTVTTLKAKSIETVLKLTQCLNKAEWVVHRQVGTSLYSFETG